MIPKKIHYCWFGKNKKSDLAEKCIESWKKYCPEYELIEWNEDNFDLDQHPYLRWCYDNEKWAFLSDFARLLVIRKYGGVYFDTDVELVRNINSLLEYGAFFGFETRTKINTGLGYGAEKEHRAVEALIREYMLLEKDGNGNYPLVVCPVLNTNALSKIGLELTGKTQQLDDVMIYAPEYFNPYDDPTGKLNKTKNTYSIHWYSKSWMSKGTILRSKITQPFHRIFGTNCFSWLKRGKRS